MLIAHPVANKPKAVTICEAFIAGAPRDAVGHVFYGVNESNAATWRQVRRLGEPWYYLDNSYFDATRGHRFRVARNSVQVQAARKKTDGRRFANLMLPIKPWRSRPEGYALLIEQSESFMACVADEPGWLAHEAGSLRDAGFPIRMRPWNRDKREHLATLQSCLMGARVVAAHTSAAAVQAALAGVPIMVSRMHALHGMVCSQDPAIDQREHCFGVLADHEFTLDEMRDGLPWRTVL